MKTVIFILVALISFVFIGCNKDEDIIEDFPPQEDFNLGYRVIEYTPAPGQYINDAVTGFKDITSMEDACRQAERRFSEGLFVSLGSWGGYIVVKFDTPIINSGGYDFSISSNSFDTSNEPGIVWVMRDSNKNGLPDDEWYELKGSYFGEEGYERNYWVNYTRPEAKKNTPWEDSNGETGVVNWMGNYHSQDFYYPNWIEKDSYTLYGSRLPLQAEMDPDTRLWTNRAFEWGYADNIGEDFLSSKGYNRFRISDAVSSTNQDVDLPEIDFVKVQTAVNGSAGWLGENSTEVCGFIVN